MSERPVRLGMVGGGRDAFIGAVHRIAARLDGNFELCAGALASTPEKARASGEDLCLPPDRIYDDFTAMAEAETRRADGIEAVAIVTPNHMHAAPAIAFLKKGIHVICDKPLTATMDDAARLAEAARASSALFVLTHNYTGYPMVRHARAAVAAGEIGRVRVVQVEYPQDWLASKLEDTGLKQAVWRTDPIRAGGGGAIGDIGTHAFNLAAFVTGLTATELCAELDRFVEGRPLDDNAHVLLRYDSGAKGFLWASQVAHGNENALRLRVYGETGGLEWAQEAPNTLRVTLAGEPPRLVTRGGPGAGPASARLTRIPAGHPEGYLEGFANIYAEAAAAIRARRAGRPIPSDILYPTIEDGLAGMAFVDGCIRSATAGGSWVQL